MSRDCDVPGYERWYEGTPADIKRDPVWKLAAYRIARFASDRAWSDVTVLARDRRTRDISSQLWRSLGAVSADIVEGYSRSSGRDRVRFYEYALGSAREAREWYLQGAPILNPARLQQAVELLSRVVRLLATYIPDQRNRIVRQALPGAKHRPASLPQPAARITRRP